MSERLQKFLANAGFGSRREIEKWISIGRISVNGKTAILGTQVTIRDKISIDNKPIILNEIVTHKTIAYHKPIGQICSRSDPDGRDTVFSHLPKLKNQRWISVGRLDINTSGLLIFTTDGELANKLMHPSYEIEREYLVRVLGLVAERKLSELTTGIKLDDGIAKFKSVITAGGEGANHWYKVILTEGKNREVRRLWEAVGVKVSRLIRIRYGSVSLNRSLQAGNFEEINDNIQKNISSVKSNANSNIKTKPNRKHNNKRYKKR